jgi:ComF family protein
VSVWRAVVRVLRSTTTAPLHSLSSVLLPSLCRVCGEPLTEFTRVPVCSSCWNQLPLQSGVLCARCGENLGLSEDQARALPDGLLCRHCRAAEPPFQLAIAHGLYEGALRTLLHLLKYDGMDPIAERLGTLLAARVLSIPNLPAELTVVPVPLHRQRRRERGFNQSERLARAVARSLHRMRPGMGVRLSVGVLERQRATESQAGLSPHQRRANLRGAFFVPKADARSHWGLPQPPSIRGQHVLLIDDIYTTGATARACSQVLRRAGAAAVWVATVARAQRYDALVPQDSPSPLERVETEALMHADVAFWGEAKVLGQSDRGRDVAR